MRCILIVLDRVSLDRAGFTDVHAVHQGNLTDLLIGYRLPKSRRYRYSTVNRKIVDGRTRLELPPPWLKDMWQNAGVSCDREY